MKKCFKCGIEKPLTNFYKHSQMKDGRVNKCKECNKKDVQVNYRKNISHFKNYDQIRNQKRKEYNKEKSRVYRDKYPEKVQNAKRKWIREHNLERAAHIILKNRLRDGKVKKGLCQICKSSEVEAHHYDYTKPVNVIWLCKKHHEKIHWWLRWNERNKK